MISTSPNNKRVLLIDPPTFPKGVLSLGLASVTSALPEDVHVTIIDMNFEEINNKLNSDYLAQFLFIGLKVSAQNLQISIDTSKRIQDLTKTPIIWGGEFPTLLKEEAQNYCDCVVLGAFEPIVNELIRDLKSGELQTSYNGKGKYDLRKASPVNIKVHSNWSDYYSFMGAPVETSRGCDKKCTFCMVHVMQNKSDFKSLVVLEKSSKITKANSLML